MNSPCGNRDAVADGEVKTLDVARFDLCLQSDVPRCRDRGFICESEVSARFDQFRREVINDSEKFVLLREAAFQFGAENRNAIQVLLEPDECEIAVGVAIVGGLVKLVERREAEDVGVV